MIRLACRAVPENERASAVALDVGCGSGRHAVALRQLGFQRVVAIDALEVMLDAVQEGADAAGVTIETLCARLPTLPLRDGSVDLIVCWGLLFTLGGAMETRAGLAEVARVLRPGGALLADWRTNSDSLIASADCYIADGTYRLGPRAPVDLRGMVYSFWTAETIRGWHEAAGLSVCELHRHELHDLIRDQRHSWWQICARRLHD